MDSKEFSAKDNATMRLDEFLEHNKSNPYCCMFNECKPPQDFFVVPIQRMTKKLYDAIPLLDDISMVKSFEPKSRITSKYSMHLYSNYFVLIKITKIILDKLLQLEDITKEQDLLKKYTSNGEFTEVPARCIDMYNAKHEWDQQLFDRNVFDNTFKFRFYHHGFKVYKVRNNKLTWPQLFELHAACLFYPSDDKNCGFLCYPVKDAKKISSLENTKEEEKSEILASILGLQLETNAEGLQLGNVAKSVKPSEEGAPEEVEGSPILNANKPENSDH